MSTGGSTNYFELGQQVNKIVAHLPGGAWNIWNPGRPAAGGAAPPSRRPSSASACPHSGQNPSPLHSKDIMNENSEGLMDQYLSHFRLEQHSTGMKRILITFSVADPWNFGTDLDLRIHTSDSLIRILLFSVVTFTTSTKNYFYSKFFCLLRYFLRYIYIIFQR